MTRFIQDLKGLNGEFWQKEAEKEIAKMQKRYDEGEILKDEDGAVYWKSNGRYLPEDCTEVLVYTTAWFDRDETARKRDIQVHKELEEYRANYTGPTEEELAEMAVEFKGQKVVNIITGDTWQF